MRHSPDATELSDKTQETNEGHQSPDMNWSLMSWPLRELGKQERRWSSMSRSPELGGMRLACRAYVKSMLGIVARDRTELLKSARVMQVG